MVIDTSALLAILLGEPEGQDFLEAIESEPTRLMSAASFLEASIVLLQRFGDDGLRDLDLYIFEAGIEIYSIDSDQARLAREAYYQFGKSRHPAGLNFGDCFSYALAKLLDQPLLFKGNDFSKTDITRYRIATNGCNDVLH